MCLSSPFHLVLFFPPTAFLNTKTILSLHMQKDMLVHRLQRRAKYLCSGLTQRLVSFHTPRLTLLLLFNFISGLSPPTGKLGAERTPGNWKAHECRAG